jgi:hypothetical protein
MAVSRTTRADQVRRRRQQPNKQRYDVSRVPANGLRSGPLVSKPRRSPSMPASLRSARPGGAGRRGFAIALPAARARQLAAGQRPDGVSAGGHAAAAAV